MGSNDGNMSKALREFQFADVSEAEWVGEDALFSERATCNYSLRAKTKLVVLEIAVVDLSRVLQSSFRNYLQSLSLRKHILLLQRIEEIAAAALDTYESTELARFYELSLAALLKLHPQASEKMLRQMGRQSVQDNKIAFQVKKTI
jgi:hypothetical protein